MGPIWKSVWWWLPAAFEEKEKEWELGEKKLLVEETKEAQLDAERPTMRNRTKVGFKF